MGLGGGEAGTPQSIEMAEADERNSLPSAQDTPPLWLAAALTLLHCVALLLMMRRCQLAHRGPLLHSARRLATVSRRMQACLVCHAYVVTITTVACTALMWGAWAYGRRGGGLMLLLILPLLPAVSFVCILRAAAPRRSFAEYVRAVVDAASVSFPDSCLIECDGEEYHEGDVLRYAIQSGTKPPHETGHSRPVRAGSPVGGMRLISAAPNGCCRLWYPTQLWAQAGGDDRTLFSSQAGGESIILGPFESEEHIAFLQHDHRNEQDDGDDSTTSSRHSPRAQQREEEKKEDTPRRPSPPQAIPVSLSEDRSAEKRRCRSRIRPPSILTTNAAAGRPAPGTPALSVISSAGEERGSPARDIAARLGPPVPLTVPEPAPRLPYSAGKRRGSRSPPKDAGPSPPRPQRLSSLPFIDVQPPDSEDGRASGVKDSKEKEKHSVPSVRWEMSVGCMGLDGTGTWRLPPSPHKEIMSKLSDTETGSPTQQFRQRMISFDIAGDKPDGKSDTMERSADAKLVARERSAPTLKALPPAKGGQPETLGVVRLLSDDTEAFHWPEPGPAESSEMRLNSDLRRAVGDEMLRAITLPQTEFSPTSTTRGKTGEEWMRDITGIARAQTFLVSTSKSTKPQTEDSAFGPPLQPQLSSGAMELQDRMQGSQLPTPARELGDTAPGTAPCGDQNAAARNR